MRGLLPAIVLLSLVPLAAAAPYDCTGAGVPTSAGIVGLSCYKVSDSDSETRVRTVWIDIAVFEAGVYHTHTTGQGEYAGCGLYFYGHDVGPDTFTYQRGCAGVRHPLLP